jgi:ANTAR domain
VPANALGVPWSRHAGGGTRAGGQLAELQLTLGEGPLLDASASGGPALASDLGGLESASRWPAFAPAACRAGAGTGPGEGPGGQPAGLASYRAEIDQATGMLTEQLSVSITDAFVRLRAYAYVNDLQLAEVARDIVARRLRLFPDPGLFPGGGT